MEPKHLPVSYQPSPQGFESDRQTWDEFHKIADYLDNRDGNYYVDIDFPITVRTVAANTPTMTTINGNLTMPQWAINDYMMLDSGELIHGWKEGSEIFVHLHLTTNGSNTDNRYVRFEIEYGYVTTDGQWVFPAVVNTGDMLIAANTPTKTQVIMSLFSFTPTDIKIGGHMLFRLKRISPTDLTPSFNPWIPMLQCHVLCDTKGSRSVGKK